MQEWITRIADDERRRDAIIAEAAQLAAKETTFVLAHGRRLLDELGSIIVIDVERFRQEFPDDRMREITVTGAEDGAFEVRRNATYPFVELTVTPQWATATVAGRYRFSPASGLPMREDRFVLVLAAEGGDARFKHQHSGRVFASVSALSEYLLTPVFTGRPSLP
jgi:hypothetical protein